MTPVDPFARLPQNNRPTPATQSSGAATQRPASRPRGGGGNGGGGGNRPNDPNNLPPSPWLDPDNPPPTPHNEASFVEYLRWMRSPDSDNKDGTKLQLLQQAEGADFRSVLQRRETQTKRLAKSGECFTVSCSWRVRVGGHRGPESILLPAFDAQGVPYIPSSTLRGVARSQAIRDVGEEKAAKIFGALDTKDKADRAGKIIFFDAYPQPGKLGLSIDMANNIWKWEEDDLKYAPNPNPFFSLHKPTLTIGLRSASHSSDTDLAQVKKWLIAGLQAGIGSQVNSGYGEMLRPGGKAATEGEFLRVKFELEGQLIHGAQKFRNLSKPLKFNRDGSVKKDRNGNFVFDTFPEEEIRPIAFKSNLRYWFRAFALGATTAGQLAIVRRLESHLFGGVQPPPSRLGWLRFNIQDIENDRSQSGTLIISLNQSLQWQDIGSGGQNRLQNLTESEVKAISPLVENLLWLAFHLGGVGQGARRELYRRPTTPRLRGSQLTLIEPDDFFKTPRNISSFKTTFHKRLHSFYENLEVLLSLENLRPLKRYKPSTHSWKEIVDSNCHILAIGDEAEGDHKSFSLEKLHKHFHGLEQKDSSQAKSLCGGTTKDFLSINGQQEKREAVPSPVFVRRFQNYQVITVFGFSRDKNNKDNPRRKYLIDLVQSAECKAKILPLPEES
jgi:CRISPR-associated protein Cmr6